MAPRSDDVMPQDSRTVLYGRDHGTYGGIVVASVGGGRTAAAISVGVDATSPSLVFKADDGVPNEDALLAIDEGDTCLLAVADAHFGHAASHDFIAALAAVPSVPRDLGALRRVVDPLDGQPPCPAKDRSESTLLAVVYDRRERHGFGLSIGDSSFAVLGPTSAATTLNEKTHRYARPGAPGIGRIAAPFEFSAAPGDLLVAFTDGIDECHYRSPSTSLQPRHYLTVLARTGSDPAAFARALVEWALSGVDGYPGGQDNVALVVSIA